MKGKIEYPFKMFQTWLSQPEINQKLEPHGMWQVQERAHLQVVDVDGTIVITKQEGQLPLISFVGKRPYRVENKQFQSQYVKCGFSHTGISSVMVRRFVTSNNQWNMTYAMQKNNFTYSVINPTSVSCS